MDEIEFILDSTKESMEHAVDHLKNELLKIRAGKASPSMLDSVYVEYYGSNTKLSQVSNVSTLDGRTLSIQPYERSIISDIERAIINSNLGLNPQNNGEVILINIPPLTEERRKTLVKQAKAEGEHAKIAIRNARKDGNDTAKKLSKDGVSEDMIKDTEAQIQKLTDSYVEKIDKLIELKEKDILTI